MKVRSTPGPLLAPLPTVMVSCGSMEESNILTVAWTGIINSNPPMTYISVQPKRHSHDIIEKSGEFVINLVPHSLVKAMDFCGVRSGRDIDKFEAQGLTREEADTVSAPLIAESPVNIECRVKDIVRMPSHDMFMAEIIAAHGMRSSGRKRGIRTSARWISRGVQSRKVLQARGGRDRVFRLQRDEAENSETQSDRKGKAQKIRKGAAQKRLKRMEDMLW